MNAPTNRRDVMLNAIRALADDYGEVSNFARRLAMEFGLDIKTVLRYASEFNAAGSLIRVGKGQYKLPDAMPRQPLPASRVPTYVTATACGIEPYTVRRPVVRDGGVGFKNVTLARVRWAERPLP